MTRRKRKSGGKLSFYIIIALFVLYLLSPEGKKLLQGVGEEISQMFGSGRQAASSGELTSEDILRIDFIDVGRGDSALITTPEEKFILVDAGTASAGEAVASHLDKAGTGEIEYFILSHPHADHIGGAAQIFDEYRINAVIMPAVATTSATYTRLLDKIEAEKKETGCRVIRAVPGKSYAVGDCTIDIFAPILEDDDDLNNASVVAKLSYKDFSLLLTGDAEKDSEELILESGVNLRSTALKVPHHGSSTSLCREYLSAISPAFAVISCEEGNSYGHPHEETVALFEEFAIDYYVTKDHGTVSVLTDGENYQVECMRFPKTFEN